MAGLTLRNALRRAHCPATISRHEAVDIDVEIVTTGAYESDQRISRSVSIPLRPGITASGRIATLDTGWFAGAARTSSQFG
jgi:hypothetical protein